MSTAEDVPISHPEDIAREMQDLELALLREGIEERTAERECCARCRRTPLVGERVYRYERGTIVCELCRSLEAGAPLSSQLVHGPAFGHTIRIIDQRAA
jgi:ribosomal protein L37AE/L43A